MRKANPLSTERIIRNVCANMKAEGFQVSAETLKECYAIIAGTRSADELVKAYIQTYKKQR